MSANDPMLSKKEPFRPQKSEVRPVANHPGASSEDGGCDLDATDATFVTKQMMRGVGRVADRGFEARVF
jgi:hypothetical protein